MKVLLLLTFDDLPLEITVTFTGPAFPVLGLVTVMMESDKTLIELAPALPKLTAELVVKFSPLMVITSLPYRDPLLGEMDLMTGVLEDSVSSKAVLEDEQPAYIAEHKAIRVKIKMVFFIRCLVWC